MRDEDRADDAVPLEGHVGGIRHELAGIPFEEAAHIPAPFLLRPDVHSVLLLDVALVDIDQELRQSEDLVLLRRLELQTLARGRLLGGGFHPHPGEHAPKAEGREGRLVPVLEMGPDGSRSAGAEQVHRLQEDRRRFGRRNGIHRESRNLRGSQADRPDQPAVLLHGEMRPLLLRWKRQKPVHVDLQVARRQVRATRKEHAPIRVGLRRLQGLESQRHVPGESLAGHQGSARGDFIRQEDF